MKRRGGITKARTFKRGRKTTTAVPMQIVQFRGTRNVRTGGFVGRELKFFDVEATDDAFATSWATMEPATTNLSAVAQGDGESQRDGRKYEIRGIYIKGYVQIDDQESNVAPPGDGLVRICLVLDKQTNGAQLSASDVMLTAPANDINSFRNLQHTERFSILFDKTIRLPMNSMVNEGAINLFANGNIRVPFKINKTFKTPIMVNTDGTTADIANITTNSLHMIGVERDSIFAKSLSYVSRLRFTG